jgi:hypothetical protein
MSSTRISSRPAPIAENPCERELVGRGDVYNTLCAILVLLLMPAPSPESLFGFGKHRRSRRISHSRLVIAIAAYSD